MKNEKFNKLKRLGELGVQFFIERHNELLISPIQIKADLSDWNIEGFDLAAERIELMPTSEIEEVMLNKSSYIGQALKPYLIYGGVEVKTLGWEQVIPRFGVDDCPNGTYGVPVWSATEDKENGWTGYTRDKHGNLWRWMEPSVDNRSSRPLILAHLLACDEYNRVTAEKDIRFFAAIIFEDMNALLERLTEFLGRFGININDWDSIPTGELARRLMVEGLYVQGNMIQIPLQDVLDLATVTMIGDDPILYPTGRCSLDLQESRLEYLKKMARGRWIPQVRNKQAHQTGDDTFWLRWLLRRNNVSGIMDQNGNPLE